MQSFGQRLKLAFDNAINAEIARKLEVSEGAVTNYVNGRVPDAEKLLRIATLTKCDLHWLLTGEGKPPDRSEPPSLMDVLDDRIRQIVHEELAATPHRKPVMPLDVGSKKQKEDKAA